MRAKLWTYRRRLDAFERTRAASLPREPVPDDDEAVR
jgi:hypothetical protein